MRAFCHRDAAAAAEPLGGTAAASTDAWLLVEYSAGWAPRSPKANRLPRAVDEHLRAWLASRPGARWQFIKRHPRDPAPHGTLMVARSTPGRERLRAVRFDEPGALRDLDLDALLDAPTPPAGAEALGAPVHLVCTHGKRDPCCALMGLPVFEALHGHVGARAWQTTHLGGHRFAPTLVSLPSGLCYGRLTPDEAPALADALDAGRVHDPDKLRGRCLHDAPTQAAEVALLQRLPGPIAVDALRHARTIQRAADRWEVTFEHDGAPRTLTVTRARSTTPRPPSCGDEAVPFDRFNVGSPEGDQAGRTERGD